MTEIKCKYEDLATTISSITTEDTYNLRITDPSNIIIQASSGAGSLGYILSKNAVTGVLFDLTYTDLTQATLTSLDYAFKGCINIKRIGALPDNLLTSGEGTFMNCTNLVNADIDSYDNVVDASYLFSGCTSLKYISTNRLTKVTEANEMFANCTSLESIDICMMSDVINADNMFENCTSLKTLLLSKQFVIDLKSSSNMLTGCTALTDIKQVDPAIIDRASLINGGLEINGRLNVSDGSEKKGAIIHGELVSDNIKATAAVSSPTVNTSAIELEGNTLTTIDNELYYNGKLLIDKGNMELTASKDGALAWKGLITLGEVSSTRRTILITKVDDTHSSTLSGQILLYGENALLGTYHIDLNGTGSHSFMGASSGEKASIVYCTYKGEKYFGLNFVGNATGKIFFIGWKNAGESFAAPDYDTYVESDVTILKTFGYSISSEFATKALSVKPIEDGPAMKGCVSLGSINGNKIILLIKQSTAYLGTIGGELFEYGDEINSMYHFSISSNGSRSITGSSSYEEKASIVQVVYDDETYYGIKFPSGKEAQLLFQGFDTRTNVIMPPTSYSDDDFTIVADIEDDSSSSGEIVTVEIPEATSISAEFTTSNSDLETLGLHQTAYENVKILNEVSTCLYPSGTKGGNTGYLYVSSTCKILTFKVAGPCTIEYGFTSADSTALKSLNVGITDTLVTYQATTTYNNSIGVSTINYADTNSRTLYMTTDTAVNIMYLKVTYDSATITNLGANIIASLPETGDDTYHMIKLNGELTKAALVALAQQLRESDKQVYLDLSACTVASDANQWTQGAGLNNLFANCTGLRGFKMPQGVTIIQGNVFYSCISLKELILNDDLEQIGSSNESTLAGLFAATPLTTIELPASIKKLLTYFLTNSNVKKLIFKSPCAAITNREQLYQYYCFYNTQAKLTLYMDQSLYDYIHSYWWYSNSNTGADLTDKYVIQ